VLGWLVGHVTLFIAIAIVAVVLLWAFFPGLFTSQNPTAVNPEAVFLPPSARHWFGTDEFGRDLYTRVVYGSRTSLTGAAVAVAVAVVVGSVLGSLAGWFGGLVDSLIGRVMDVVLSIPGFLFAITIVAILGFGIFQSALAVGLTSSATFARLIRSEVLKASTSNYVEAATTSGARTFAILRRHVIPNSIAPTFSLITIQFGIAIIWIASLSFLGLGAQPPKPEWGLLVSDGRDFIASRSWLAIWPGLTVVAVVLSINHIAHHISKGRPS
jgi:peptide/nickel transport system permease protein